MNKAICLIACLFIAVFAQNEQPQPVQQYQYPQQEQYCWIGV